MGDTGPVFIALSWMTHGEHTVFISYRDLQLTPNNQIPLYFLSQRAVVSNFVQHPHSGPSAWEDEAERSSTW